MVKNTLPQSEIAAAIPSNGIFLTPALVYLAGMFYAVRKGAVKYIQAPDQEKLMAEHKARLDALIAERRKVKTHIRPIGKAGVADFLAYARKQGVIS